MDKDTAKTAETEVNGQVKNDAQTAKTITTPNTDEVIENLRKEKDKAEMRARQLENEKLEREKQDEIARQKQLEENNEFKALYEREQAARLELERKNEETAKQVALDAAKSEILATYPTEVTELAETTGISLSDDSETSKGEYKKKLDAIASKVTTATKKVVGNNGVVTEGNDEDTERTLLNQRMRYNDKTISSEARRAAISKIPALKEMKKMAGLSEE